MVLIDRSWGISFGLAIRGLLFDRDGGFDVFAGN
jgi:hypothetical protein